MHRAALLTVLLVAPSGCRPEVRDVEPLDRAPATGPIDRADVEGDVASALTIALAIEGDGQAVDVLRLEVPVEGLEAIRWIGRPPGWRVAWGPTALDDPAPPPLDATLRRSGIVWYRPPGAPPAGPGFVAVSFDRADLMAALDQEARRGSAGLPIGEATPHRPELILETGRIAAPPLARRAISIEDR